MIHFITWVNDESYYSGLLDSLAPLQNSYPINIVKVGQEAKSMAQAYNIGTQKSGFQYGDILVYCHQDVRILDTLFIPRLIQATRYDNQVGFVGPVGNLSTNDASWWTVGIGQCRGGILQGNNPLWFGSYDGPARQLDGLLLATNKLFTFPEELPGIHFLDLWMCREAEKQGYQNRIFWTIVQHLSGGECSSQSYRDNLLQYRKHWNL
jgi:hypothetical protein